jgi:2'-5' RNA ligase
MTSMAETAPQLRCFWAVPLPSELRGALADFVADLRALPAVEDAWRFAAPDSWHLTLAFVAAIEPQGVEPMTERVGAAVQHHAPFLAAAAGLGGFPRGSRARVLWLGVEGGDELAHLAREVNAAAGLDDDGPWRAHITLARSRDRHGAVLPRLGAPPTGSIPVTQVVLFRSHLGSGPARYEALHRLALGSPVAALPS